MKEIKLSKKEMEVCNRVGIRELEVCAKAFLAAYLASNAGYITITQHNFNILGRVLGDFEVEVSIRKIK